VTITHPDKVLFPDDGITKADLAAYYQMVAPVMLPHICGRPVTLERYHRGIAEAGFFQKNVAKGPDWLERVEVPKRDGVVHHPLICDARSLEWMANQNCITPHVWTSRVPHLDRPDLCVFDLDPSTDDAAAVRTAALALRDLLAELTLPSWIKTTGSKGFHIVVPLDGEASFEDVGRFAYAVGRLLVRRDPARLTQEFAKADRGGRIFIDTGRNGYSATFAAPYAVRAKPHAPISAPCTWDEVERGEVGPQTCTLRSMEARLQAVGDVWAALGTQRYSFLGPAERLKAELGDEWVEDLGALHAEERAQAMHEGLARSRARRGKS
jgi:bifunctional non-homologous end joining protein LigD